MDARGRVDLHGEEQADLGAAGDFSASWLGGLNNDWGRHGKNPCVRRTYTTYTAETRAATSRPPALDMERREIPETANFFPPVMTMEEVNNAMQLAPSSHHHRTPDQTPHSQRAARGAQVRRSALMPVHDLGTPTHSGLGRTDGDPGTPAVRDPHVLANGGTQSPDLTNWTSPVSQPTPRENNSRAQWSSNRRALGVDIEPLLLRGRTAARLASSQRVPGSRRNVTRRRRPQSPPSSAESSVLRCMAHGSVFEKKINVWLPSAYVTEFKEHLKTDDLRQHAVYDKWKNVKDKPNGRCVGFCHRQRRAKRSRSDKCKRFCAAVSSTAEARCHYTWTALEAIELTLPGGKLKVS
eukprot:CAMPEP_0198351908 /NCGR_PEP_ID=MMETSP1450-20131203/104754_1 /TAXON_ID=753684 ORGANISM="Madagascaria erythrocladiodes, Strain CCMP3234" /NCGR_SAMPLE_ID=MMETSP1450 /ASSEMBLY_ACC=CAM_ASM_001115 /LENGTH=351 /DNA_ID=CAMNT_0044057883 /DNA_START=163 /DNA_END=1214 /DNA_ORIENTATION=-